jgi:hypothetical protein
MSKNRPICEFQLRSEYMQTEGCFPPMLCAVQPCNAGDEELRCDVLNPPSSFVVLLPESLDIKGTRRVR